MDSTRETRREREAREYRARQAEKRAADVLAHPERYAKPRRRRARRSEYASRAEQHATYLEVGPGAWDDRDSESGDY
jgi:hypothetical protein